MIKEEVTIVKHQPDILIMNYLNHNSVHAFFLYLSIHDILHPSKSSCLAIQLLVVM